MRLQQRMWLKEDGTGTHGKSFFLYLMLFSDSFCLNGHGATHIDIVPCVSSTICSRHLDEWTRTNGESGDFTLAQWQSWFQGSLEQSLLELSLSFSAISASSVTTDQNLFNLDSESGVWSGSTTLELAHSPIGFSLLTIALSTWRLKKSTTMKSGLAQKKNKKLSSESQIPTLRH